MDSATELTTTRKLLINVQMRERDENCNSTNVNVTTIVSAQQEMNKSDGILEVVRYPASKRNSKGCID